jgi:hypothetical protein
MPLRPDGSRKPVAVLKICPSVGEHCIATGQFAVAEYNYAGSFSLRGPEPGRIASVSQHAPPKDLCGCSGCRGSSYRLHNSLLVCLAFQQLAAPARRSADLPDGRRADFPVQPLLKKYSGFPKTQISCMSPAVPSHSEGRLATSRTRGGMRWTRRRA